MVPWEQVSAMWSTRRKRNSCLRYQGRMKKAAPRAEPEPRKAKATKAPKKGGEKVLI